MASDSDPQADDQDLLEEHVVKPAMRRQLQDCYERGTKLSEGDKVDHDYANTMFTQCVVNDPGNLVYVEAFLANLGKKYESNKKKAKIKGFGSRGPFKKALSKKDWRQLLKVGPDLLKQNPWDVPTLRGMADACAAFGYNETELRYLRNALDADPNDVDVNRHCGTSLARMGQFDQAIACFHRIEEINPKDTEATKMVGLLTEDKARVASGRPPKTIKPIARRKKKTDETEETPQAENEPQEVEEEKKPREIKLTPRQELERKLVDNPSDIDSYLKLAELLQNEDRHGDAERVLTKALGASGNDLKIQELLEDAQVKRMQHQLAIAEKRADVEQTDQATLLAKQMKQELNRREVAVFGSRVERYPTDHKLKLELAVRLKKDGNYGEAAKYLMTAREDLTIKAQATLEAGECLQHQKKFANALQFYGRAAELAEDDLDIKMKALYRAGVLSIGLKELDKAEAFLRELARIDDNYQDVAARLDKIKQIRDKG